MNSSLCLLQCSKHASCELLIYPVAMKRLKFGVTLRCELLEMLLKTNVIIGTISL